MREKAKAEKCIPEVKGIIISSILKCKESRGLLGYGMVKLGTIRYRTGNEKSIGNGDGRGQFWACVTHQRRA